MVTDFVTCNPQTATTAEKEFAKLRRDQKLDVDKTAHTRSHLEKLQKKEIKKEARHPTIRLELTVAPKWRREHPSNFGNPVRFGPDRVCQAANPRRDGPCRCTPCRQAQVQTRSVMTLGQKEGPVCHDKRKRVGGTAALPAVVVDQWIGEEFRVPESGSEDESDLYTAEEESHSSHPVQVDIWDLVKPAKSRKHKGMYHLWSITATNAQWSNRVVGAWSNTQCNTIDLRRFWLGFRGVGGAGGGANDRLGRLQSNHTFHSSLSCCQGARW